MKSTLDNFIFAIGILAIVPSFYFTWKVIPHFYSDWDKYRTSKADIVITRFLVSVAVSAVVAFLIIAVFSSKTENTEKVNIANEKQQSIDEKEIKSNSENKQHNIDSIKSTSKKEDVIKNLEPIASKEQPSIEISEKTYTDDEIKELEDKAQYHGSDPIIRKRLGLPPRNVQ